MSGAVTAAVVGGTIAAGAGIAGSAIQAGAAGKAASTQAQTAQNAAAYQKQAADQAIAYQQQQNQQTQQNLAPWQQSGQQANSGLSYLLGLGGPNAGQTPYQPGAQPQGSTAQPQLTASIGNTSTPAFQNPNGTGPIQAQSNVAVSNPISSAYNPNGAQPVTQATPGALTGTTGVPQTQASGFAPGTAPGTPGVPTAGTTAASGVAGYGALLNPYQDFSAPTGLTMENDPGYQARLQLGTDAIQRSAAAKGDVLSGATGKALDTYAQDYASNEYGNVYQRALNTYGANQGNYYTGQNDAYSRLMGVSSQGQGAATNASALGQSGANSVAGTLMQGAQAVNQQSNNAALATATGYQNQGNIYGNAIAGAGNNFANLYALQNQNSGNPYATLYNAQNPSSRSSIQTTNPNLSSYQIS